MISLAERSAPTGPAPGESTYAASRSNKHERTLGSYLLNSHRGAGIVRDIIVADIRGFIDLGLPHVAADLIVVLRLFLARFPEARRITTPPVAWDGGSPAPSDFRGNFRKAWP
ncbi:MAG: hypothetical protein C3F11_03850 [Methylocystaceae bacterium]|nr:MAG: hypothetical protein C3F11_03850 [Methylocystaceae bacterium]